MELLQKCRFLINKNTAKRQKVLNSEPVIENKDGDKYDEVIYCARCGAELSRRTIDNSKKEPVVPDNKPEVKPEIKPETKPEITPETKPETKPKTVNVVTPQDVKTKIDDTVKTDTDYDYSHRQACGVLTTKFSL